MSAAIGSMKELGVAVWRAADKAEPVKNQDCRDYTMTKTPPRTVAPVSNCAFSSGKLPYCHFRQMLHTKVKSF